MARQYVLDHTPLRNLRTRVKRLWRSLPDSLLNKLPVLPEFSRLKGYDRAREIIIETCSEGASLRQVLGLDPCEQCGRELTRWKWWEAIKVIEGQDERVAPVQIMGSFSTKEEAQQRADELNRGTTEQHTFSPG